ncbi:DUF998 domain-containing protein [Acidimangrovimonas sediminis]|uniref:DUF998 domain-containing protein n=1 Tax=Acidimangrovimonas sediminis TaxID=2056283 RepID=UPI001304FB21|nr:DUF998 domain-containing protein [Acidimangrovimonas sediminis]
MSLSPQSDPRRDRHFALGAGLWICCLQYFVVERLSILDWRGQYSLSRNVISDLGALGCRIGGAHPLCSPLHPLANASFMAQGLLIAGGAALMWRGRRPGMGPGLALAALAAPGVTLVGVFPENSIPLVHYFAAGENFVAFAAAGFAFAWGFARRAAPWRALMCLFAGGLSAAGTILLAHHWLLGLGVGTLERITVYPQPLALGLLGAAFLAEGPAPAKPRDRAVPGVGGTAETETPGTRPSR